MHKTDRSIFSIWNSSTSKMVKRVASASDVGSTTGQPQLRTSSIPSLPKRPEFPQSHRPLTMQQRRNPSSPLIIPPRLSTLRHQTSADEEPTTPPTPRIAPIHPHPRSSEIPIVSLSTLVNDLRPTSSPFTLTIENEAGKASIKKESYRITEAKVETMKAESKAQIDIMGLTQQLEDWRVKEETKAKIEAMKKESETIWEIIRNERNAQIYFVKEDSKSRMV